MVEQAEHIASGVDYHGPLYDSHAHLVSDDLVRYPRNPIPRSGPGAVAPRLPPGVIGIPGGMHGPNPINEKPSAEQMRGWMDEENVAGIAAVQKGMLYRTDNSYIVDAAALFPDVMRAIIIVDPEEPGTPKMIRDLVGRGVVGIRFFGAGVKDKVAWLTSPAALEIWALADELGIAVDIEAPAVGGEALIPVIETMADRFPNLPIVLDHLLMPGVTNSDHGITATHARLAMRDKVFFKFTSINLDVSRERGVDAAAVLRRAVDVWGADKVMWGSDIGTSSGTYKEMVARAIASTALLSDEERRKILHDTGRRLFGQ